jgi:hypothetical protein
MTDDYMTDDYMTGALALTETPFPLFHISRSATRIWKTILRHPELSES